jgi:hypothetical protein
LTDRRRLAVAFAAAVALAGCGHTSSSAGSAATGKASTTSTSASASTSSVPGSATTAVTTRSCPAASLTAAVTGSSGAAGTMEITVVFRNISSTTCVLGGYPGGQMLDTQGTQIPTTVVRGGSLPFTNLAPSVVTLGPGGVAYFNLGFSDVPTGTETTCPRAVSLIVTPPGAYDHVTIAVAIAPCANGLLTVSPVFGPGSVATQTTA